MMMARTAQRSRILSRWPEKTQESYTENVQPIPDPDFEVLSKVLSQIWKSYKTLMCELDYDYTDLVVSGTAPA